MFLKKGKKFFKIFIRNVLITSLLVSCMTDEPKARGRVQSNVVTGNYFSSVGLGNARVLVDDPIALSGNPNLDESFNPIPLLREVKITDSQLLTGSCEGNNGKGSVANCFQVFDKPLSSPLLQKNYRWGYVPATNEWAQVQGFYHLKIFTEKFHSELLKTYLQYAGGIGSIPFSLYDDGGNWNTVNPTFTLYASNGIQDDAYFSPSLFSVNLGYVSTFTNVLMVEDPSVINHELGHMAQSVLLNLRNANLPKRSDLGYLSYDEAGAIGEGLSDYFSFIMNKRTHFSPFVLGRFLNSSRPMTESDPLHIPGLSETSEGRLRYPQYLIYDPNNHTKVTEDIHYAGMITSHFLTALTGEIESRCSLTSKDTAISGVFSLLSQTLSELGDLRAKGSDSKIDSVNLNQDSSLEWIKVANPINYHTFFQTFSKYAYNNYLSLGNCPSLSKDFYEKLLDSYGLLLFKTYNLDGNGFNPISEGHGGPTISVTTENRQKSILISKNLIDFDQTAGAYQAYVIDKAEDVKKALDSMVGQISPLSPQIPSGLDYNNNNGAIGQGEVIGLALNLFNSSNSPMGGVQVLANDWDHFNIDSSPKPCNNLGDNFPLASEGGSSDNSCQYTTHYNGLNPLADNGKKVMPVCFVQKQSEDGSSTQWVSQKELLNAIADPSLCLGGSSKTDDCFVRALKGADTAYFSYIAPQSNWLKSLSNDGKAPKFQNGNLIFFEINPRTPQGTTFNCRFRVRFSNCEDCYHDTNFANDNFYDYEFSGGKPFKIINLRFTILN